MKKEPKTENWEERYQIQQTGWDIGHASRPLREYIDQLEDKQKKILIPGAGNAYEAEYFWKQGFENVHVLDIAPSPLKNLAERLPEFPKDQLIQGDFFDHDQQYDLILEQTFFCAIDPILRADYAQKSKALLKPQGKLVGLLWSVDLNEDHPPYGGSKAEYLEYFEPHFDIHTMEKAHNSIPPRADRELFIRLDRKA